MCAHLNTGHVAIVFDELFGSFLDSFTRRISGGEPMFTARYEKIYCISTSILKIRLGERKDKCHDLSCGREKCVVYVSSKALGNQRVYCLSIGSHGLHHTPLDENPSFDMDWSVSTEFVAWSSAWLDLLSFPSTLSFLQRTMFLMRVFSGTAGLRLLVSYNPFLKKQLGKIVNIRPCENSERSDGIPSRRWEWTRRRRSHSNFRRLSHLPV